jgi:hypothetical protein
MAVHLLQRVQSGLETTGQALSAAHGAYQIGKQLWAGATFIAPYAAALL